MAATRGRPPADPVERENARLRERNARLKADLDTARRVIEVQGKVSAAVKQHRVQTVQYSGVAADFDLGSRPQRSRTAVLKASRARA